MQKDIAKFSVKHLSILDESGKVDEKLMPKITHEEIKKIYELLVLTRVFDDKAIKLQREGRLGTYASVKGQEACQIPSAMQFESGDLLFPAFREHGVFFARGTSAEKLFQYWGGDERGMNIPNVNVFPVAITVGGHLPHAVGVAMAYKYQKKNNVTAVYFGDGATSEGDFHEALNFAGVFKAGTIFYCQNNQFAISTPVSEQSASQTLAQKAIAYGFEGIRVDGNDVFAVYVATQNAIKKARAGKGPTFIECLTFRMGDHTTSDDAKRYRSEEVVKEWEKKDPILRLKNYMIHKKMFSDDYEREVWQRSEEKINESFTNYEKILPAPPEEIFNYVFDKLTPELAEELEQFKREVS